MQINPSPTCPLSVWSVCSFIGHHVLWLVIISSDLSSCPLIGQQKSSDWCYRNLSHLKIFQRCKILNFDWCSCSGPGSNKEGDATAHSTSEVWKPYFKSSANYFQIGNAHRHSTIRSATQMISQLLRKIRNQCLENLN